MATGEVAGRWDVLECGVGTGAMAAGVWRRQPTGRNSCCCDCGFFVGFFVGFGVGFFLVGAALRGAALGVACIAA
jgi:hypothetical protein